MARKTTKQVPKPKPKRKAPHVVASAPPRSRVAAPIEVVQVAPVPEPVPEPSPTSGYESTRTLGCPIIGIGASAGGLEALEVFLRRIPPRAGAAFVIVQHLDPHHKGMLVELLQRVTALAVVEASDGARTKPEHVYVIPPGKDMSVLHGSLHLLPQPGNRARVMPIDFFFRSLAHDQGERAIGVILSGMGSDGSLGLRAIKEVGGATFVQAPASAKFDGMPRTAIEAGVADVVAPIEELPAKILAYRDHVPFLNDGGESRLPDAQSGVDKICVLLREYSGNDFSVYKRSTIYRRIERRMGLHQIASFADYLRYLRENTSELETLFQELLIGVTSFFRDPGEWDRLRAEVLPGLVTSRIPGGVLRAWVPGCSTGEEAYSLAILFREALEPVRMHKQVAVQIFATDLDREAIDKARMGLYPENIAADVPPERLRRFFVREERGYRVSKEIRESVVFAPQNVIMDPPFTKVDVISCRNLLIYLGPEIQRKLIPLFHYCLNPGGVLFLGSAETVGAFTSLFTPLDSRTRLYRRVDRVVGALPIDLQLTAFGRGGGARLERDEASLPAKGAMPSVQTLVDRLLVQRFGPLGVLCSIKGDVLYISGRAGKYFEPAVGKANLNLIAMAREGLRYELAGAFATAVRSERPVVVRGVKVGTNGGTQHVDVTVQHVNDPKELAGTVIVVLEEVAGPAAAPKAGKRQRQQPRVGELEAELRRSREEVQTIREEMQTSQEELKSTNEELQSTNEELQSTNEELTTSKEEMQSLNEELQTVNQELQAKVDELSRSNNDMKNLLNSTDIATLFLDADLRVRRFTTATAKIIKLIAADIGRPITDIASDLDYGELADDSREVLRTLIFKETQVATRDGRAFSVRIMPYRTLDNVIDGVVITFTDAAAVRALERAAREQTSQLRQIADALPHLVFGARPDGAFDFLSRQWTDYTGVAEADQLRWGWLEQVHPADRERVRDEWRSAVKTESGFDSELRICSRTGGYRWFRASAVPVRDGNGKVARWYGSSTDIDDMKRAEDRLRSALRGMTDGVLELDPDLKIVTANAAFEKIVGHPGAELVGRSLLEVIPATQPVAETLRHAPVKLELAVDGRTYQARTEQDAGGVWMFLSTTGGGG